jgi:P4 family phage/plasmid primase-like protien
MDNPAFNNLLKKNRVDGVLWTHVSLFCPKGKYQMDRRSMETFWKHYLENVEKQSSDTENIMSLAEKPQQYIPVLVDVDLKHSIGNVSSSSSKSDMADASEDVDPSATDIAYYTEDHITQTIEHYQSTIRSILENCDDRDLTCVVLEKEPYVITKGGKRYLKNGFHLHFPYVFLRKMDHELHLLPRVKEALQEADVFGDLGFTDIDKVIDASYTKTPWLLYGSAKEAGFQPYTATKVYDANGSVQTIEEGLADYTIFNEKEQSINIEGKVSYYLPRILSIIPFGREIREIRVNLSYPIQNTVKSLKETESKQYVRESIEVELKRAEELLDIIDDSRAEDYSDWMTVGWALFCISDGTMEGLNLWLDFSKRCGEKFSESGCRYEWSKMVKKEMSLGTLKYFAKQDNPAKYREFVNRLMAPHIDKSLYGSHNDIAKALYEQYGEHMVCSSITYKEWWVFENHIWVRMDDGISLRSKISDEIVKHYERMGQEMFQKLASCAEHEKALYNEKLTRAQKLINNLKSAPFKNNVMKEAMEVFYNGHFNEKLDANPWLVGFKNGIYDVKTHIFRAGRPDDYVSKQLGVTYDTAMDENDQRVLDVHDFLEKIFPDKSVRDYFMDHSSDVFIGGNPQKLVAVWSGEGDNGKSVTQSLFEKMLSCYSIKLPTSIIVGKRTQASAACPELVRAGNGVRWAVLQEPDQKDVINIGILKELSGNDTFFARGLYKEGSEITPMFKLTLICNEPPKLPYSDKAAWNRIRVIPFETTFTDEAPADIQEQIKQKKFPKDPHFAEKLDGMTEAFAWVLLNHRKQLKKRTEPEKVLAATANYKRKNDIYRQFVEEIIIEDEGSVITLVELYSQFKEWFKDSMPNHSMPVKNEVKEYFAKSWGEMARGGKWVGYRVRTLQDDLDNGMAIELEAEDLEN